MRAKHDAANARVIVQTLLQFQSQIEARTLPLDPPDLSTKEVLSYFLSVFRRCDGNGSIGVQMIDMFKRKKCMKRCVDRRGLRCEIIDAMIEELDHLVFMFETAIDTLQCQQPVHIKSGETTLFQSAYVATGTFYPHYFCLFALERIF